MCPNIDVFLNKFGGRDPHLLFHWSKELRDGAVTTTLTKIISVSRGRTWGRLGRKERKYRRGYMDTSQILIQVKSTPNVFYQSSMRPALNNLLARDGSGSGSVRVSTGFGFSGFGFGVDFSPTVFKFGFGFGFGFGLGFWFPPVDIRNKSFGIKTNVL